MPNKSREESSREKFRICPPPAPAQQHLRNFINDATSELLVHVEHAYRAPAEETRQSLIIDHRIAAYESSFLRGNGNLTSWFLRDTRTDPREQSPDSWAGTYYAEFF